MRLDPKTMAFGLLAFALLGKSKKPSGTTLQIPGSASELRIPKDGPRLTLDELRALATQAGFPDPNLAAAVAMAESSGFSAAVGDSGKSLGLWQINIPSHPNYDPQKLFEPAYNAQAALAISKLGTDWNPWWTTMHTGAYKRYMPAPVAGTAQLEARAVEPPTPETEHVAMPVDGESKSVPGADDDDDDDAPLPLEVEVLDPVEGGDELASNGVDARVRVSDAAPRTGRGRRARRG
jgi:hypothetical protein